MCNTQSPVSGNEAAESGHSLAESGPQNEALVDPTALVEIMPGLAVVFGDVPSGLDLITLDLMPASDRQQLSTLVTSLSAAGVLASGAVEAYASAQGLFRLDSATVSVLKSGGRMAVKDGANLAAIMKNGKIVAQARLIPVSVTAATAFAAIGPAVAMAGLHMQLGELCRLFQSNLRVATDILRTLRNEQWSELEGLASALDDALAEVRELGVIPESVWETVASHRAAIDKQRALFHKNVAGHVAELQKLEGTAKQQYLEINAEAIYCDSYALVAALKLYAEYQVLRAGVARARSVGDQHEALTFERITRTTPAQIEEELICVRQLTHELVRALWINASLPGPDGVPLTPTWKSTKAIRSQCKTLLRDMQPLVERLRLEPDKPAVPETVCAPEDIDLDPYLDILRWFLQDGEELVALAFPYSMQNTPSTVAQQVAESRWFHYVPDVIGTAVKKAVENSFVAVTDRRIITAPGKEFLRQGVFGSIYSRDDVKYVRPPHLHEEDKRLVIDVITVQDNLQWHFPQGTDTHAVTSLCELMLPPIVPTAHEPAAIEQRS